MYQTPTRSSALIGRCALFSRPDSTVGSKLTNHSHHFQLLPEYFPGTRAPRFGGNLCLNWLQLFHAFSSFLLRCFHPASFKTSLHISFQMQKPPLVTYIIAFYGSMQTFSLTQRSLFLGLSDNKLISRSKEEYSSLVRFKRDLKCNIL